MALKKAQQSVEEIMKEILDAAEAAYRELEKTGDYKSFDRALGNIYRSYAIGTKENYQEAMARIISQKVTNKDPKVVQMIIGGNYGFRIQAFKDKNTQEIKKISEELKEKYGEKVAETYLTGAAQQNKCAIVALYESKKMGKQIDNVFYGALPLLDE